MPTYSLRQHDNGIFYIHWTEGRRSKRESTGQEEETAAQIYLGEWLKGEAADRGETAQTYLVADLLPLYSNFLERKGSSPRKHEIANLTAHFGTLTLAQVAAGQDGETKVDEYIDLRAEGELGRCPAAPATIRSELAIMKACFNWCADAKRKLINPADVPVFDLPPDSPPRDRWLRSEQIIAFTAAAAELVAAGEVPEQAEWFCWLALETGARRGAILQLSKKRIDFDVGLVDYRIPGARVTRKRRAVVPISKSLRPVLQRACAKAPGDTLFDGTHYTRFYQWMRKITKHAGIDIKVGPHVMRHTAATHMLRNGVPIWIVAGVLGDTIATVERVYGHHIPSDLSQGVESIFGALQQAAE